MTIASTILMIRPAGFGFNEETATNNFFQSPPTVSLKALRQKVLSEFDGMVDTLRSHGINVIVVEDTLSPVKPDAIFPNNWFATSPEGVVSIFPMYALSRRAEKRDDIIQSIASSFEVKDVQDWSEYEAEARYLEGTGSMVIDHDNRIIFACISDRTDPSVLERFATTHGFKAIGFVATDFNKKPVYHTNVMMCLGDGFAVACLESIQDETERIAVAQLLATTEREIIEITLEQMHAFAGNMLQVKNNKGNKYLVLSQTAYISLTESQMEKLEKFSSLLPVEVHTIEEIEGGSVRCMMAEIFLQPKKIS